MGPLRPSVIMCHPETVKILLRTQEPKPTKYGGAYATLLPWLGKGSVL